MAKLVSKTYGDALFEVALEKNQLDEFLDEVKAAQTAIEENKELFKLMIVDKGHFDKVDSVFTYFIDEVKEYKNIGTAYVTSAMELSDAQKKAVEKRLLETTKYVKFEMHYDVESALIGGMVIRIGDRVVDSSVKTKLYDLTRELSKIQLKAGECAS